jgi:GAF domain-containing protein/ABC-type uncharacterized transport system substrate-binding protein
MEGERMKHKRASLFFVLVFVIAWGRFDQAHRGLGTSHAQGERQQVLVLHSYHQGYKWTDDITAGIESVLGEENVDLRIEYMDTKRIFDENYLQELYQIYQYKFSDSRFDVIISSDDNAFNFLLQHRDQLFPGTPVVFCGVNFFQPSALEGHKLFTGVNEDVDVRGSLEIALKLHPNTRQVVLINDTTTTGLRVHEKIASVVSDYEPEIEFVWLEDVEMAEIQTRVQTLPSSSLILYTLFFRDKAGKFFEYDDSISQIAARSQAPIYGAWDFSLGYGIVGGLLTRGYSQGETAAQLAQRILNGEDVANIPIVQQSPNRYMFDYEQMKRFGVGESDLPLDSDLINKPFSFIERYRNLVWSIVIGVIIAATISVALLRTMWGRRQAEKELWERNRELQAVRDTLEQFVVERTGDLERRNAQLEAAAHVAKDAAAIHDVGRLLNETVRLISDHFGFYHAGIFLLDESREYAVLRAASSEGGQKMLDRGCQLKVGEVGIVGVVANTSQPRIALDFREPQSNDIREPTRLSSAEAAHAEGSSQALLRQAQDAKSNDFREPQSNDMGEDTIHSDSPDLPRTRSEMAVPLVVRGRVIGVLDVQSTEAAAFTSEDVAVLQVLADQVALAIENARLLKAAQDRLSESRALAGQYEKQGWGTLATEKTAWGYVYDGVEVTSRDTAPVTETTPQLSVPLRVRDETIGKLNLVLGEQEPGSEEVELAQAITEQASQALERARLFQETQRRVNRERIIREVSDKMQRATDQEALMRVTAEELNRILGTSRTYVRLGTEDELRGKSELEERGVT